MEKERKKRGEEILKKKKKEGGSTGTITAGESASPLPSLISIIYLFSVIAIAIVICHLPLIDLLAGGQTDGGKALVLSSLLSLSDGLLYVI